jgi:hypothetical protein
MVLGSNQPDQATFPDCLHSSSGDERFELKNHPECNGDPLNLARDPVVVEAEKIFSLTATEITFIGCATAPFAARMSRIEPSVHFEVLYHSDAKLNYLAPTLHELGHLYQLKKAGSPQRLGGTIERIELGADFLAGLAAQKLAIENPNLFQRSLFLAGSYTPKSDSHGKPEDRASAFRYGYFYQPSRVSLEAAYADFQDNLFSQIMHNS